MKARWFVVFMPLFVTGACKKPAVNPPSDPSRMVAEQSSKSAKTSDNPVSPEAVSEGENQRARPRPRPPKPEKPPETEYPVAQVVPGKEGYVLSPFNNRVIDTRDVPSGTLVADPTYPSEEKKIFRVP